MFTWNIFLFLSVLAQTKLLFISLIIKSATLIKKMPEEVSENKDTIQTERDHIIMLLKRWRKSREETEIQKTKDVFENGKPSVTCSQNI